MVYALLIDNGGSVLLIRRRGSALWSLPGGEFRPGTSTESLLTTYSQRQTGLAPDAFGPLQAFALAGAVHGVAVAAVTRARVGARGRIEAIHWANAQSLPTETEPVARVAVATMLRELMAARNAAASVPVEVRPPVLPA